MGETDFSEGRDRYRMLLRLQIAAAVGCGCILLYSAQFWRTGSLPRIAAVGLMLAGAALVLGFVLGFIFAVPRTKLPEHGDSGQASSGNAPSVEPNSNLVDISDWLTKILVGVGLVELNKIPGNLWRMSVALSPGLRSVDTCVYESGSTACCVAILLFFFGLGFLFGYLWTRLYFQKALSDLGQADRVNRAWLDATDAEQLMREGKLNDAMRMVDGALALNASNTKALFLKARVLKRLAQTSGLPGDVGLLTEALYYAAKVVHLLPNKGGPRYNLACYQALAGIEKKEVLKNLEAAFGLNPALKVDARADPDLVSLREDTEFTRLLNNE